MLWNKPSSVHDALDLIDREGLAADRQQRRGFGEIDRTDHALDLRGDRHRIVRRVLGGRREGIVAGGLRGAVAALAVPGERLVVAGGDIVAARENVEPLLLAMVILTVEVVGTLSCQVALLSVSAAVLPLTTAVLPTNPSAWVDCAVCCRDTSVASESLVLSCC
jgi:hypothetical protein